MPEGALKKENARLKKIVADPSPNYGYRFNESRDTYVVDGEKMAVARRIFKMVGVRGITLNPVWCALEEGIPSSSGRRHCGTSHS